MNLVVDIESELFRLDTPSTSFHRIHDASQLLYQSILPTHLSLTVVLD